MKATIPGIFSAVVLCGALFAALFVFSPRPFPAFAAASVQADRVHINGMTCAGSRLAAGREGGFILAGDVDGTGWATEKVSSDRDAMFYAGDIRHAAITG